MRNRILIALILSPFALALLALAIVSAPEAASGVSGRVLRLAGRDWGAPSPFLFYPRGPGYLLMSLLFDTLMWKDSDGLCDLLAGSHERIDGRTYRFGMKKGVLWHDGAPLTAEDVAFSYRYLAEHGFSWALLDLVESVTAEGDTVLIRLRQPHEPFLERVAGVVPVIPRHVWKDVKDPRRFTGGSAFVGSGPFILAEYRKEPGTRSFRRNGKYHAGRVVVAGLELSVKILPMSVLDAFMREGNFDLAMTGRGLGEEPDVLRMMFHEWPMLKGAGWRNEEFERLTLAQCARADRQKRLQMIRRLQRIIAADLPVLPLWYPKAYFVYRRGFDRWYYMPGGAGHGIPLALDKPVFVERSR